MNTCQLQWLTLADDDRVGVRKDGGDGEAARALDVHEEAARGGHKVLQSRESALSSCNAVTYRAALSGPIREQSRISTIF